MSFSGALTDHLLHRIENKTQRLALMAQVSPSLIEWLRNQVELECEWWCEERENGGREGVWPYWCVRRERMGAGRGGCLAILVGGGLEFDWNDQWSIERVVK